MCTIQTTYMPRDTSGSLAGSLPAENGTQTPSVISHRNLRPPRSMSWSRMQGGVWGGVGGLLLSALRYRRRWPADKGPCVKLRQHGRRASGGGLGVRGGPAGVTGRAGATPDKARGEGAELLTASMSCSPQVGTGAVKGCVCSRTRRLQSRGGGGGGGGVPMSPVD